jgi:hypothetical protein
MGQHDAYGKHLMALVGGTSYSDWGSSLEVDFGAGEPGRIDGTIGGQIAVEIESRVSKQVRGAVLDLVLHPYEKKLLILMPVHMTNPVATRDQCRNILARLLKASTFEVVLISGSGDQPNEAVDLDLIREALRNLGWPAV